MTAPEPRKTMLRQISDEMQRYLGAGFFALAFAAMALAATIVVPDSVARGQFYVFIGTLAGAVVGAEASKKQ